MSNHVPVLGTNFIKACCTLSNSASAIEAVENKYKNVLTIQLGGLITNQVPNLVFSTLFPSTIGYNDWQFDRTVLGVLPYVLISNKAIYGTENVSYSQASLLMLESGPSTDSKYIDVAPAIDFGISSPASVYLVGDADADLFLFLEKYFNLYSNANLNWLVFFWTTNTDGLFSENGQYFGYYGSVLDQNGVAHNYDTIYNNTNELPAYSYASTAGIVQTHSDALGYVTMGQYNSVATNVTAMAYDGVPFSPANVVNGGYTLWGYEQVLNMTNALTADQQTVRDALINSITNTSYQATFIFTNSLIPISNMKVDRQADGGIITPHQF